jgi:SAM-dependent methyltransferase
VKRLSTRPSVFLFTRALVTDDFGPIRERVRQELVAPGRRTLDLGCGPGTFADLFAGEDYVGVDTNRRHIEYARRMRPGAFLTGGLRNLDLPEARFDQALACGLFEHFADGAALAILAEVRRVLVPGGRLRVIVELPAAGRLGRLRQAMLGAVSRRSEEYRRLLGEAGSLGRLEAFRSGLTDCLSAQVRTRETAGPRG